MTKYLLMKLVFGQKDWVSNTKNVLKLNELQCIVCGGPAGCPQCEFQENCDIPNVSQLCICKKCSEEKDAFSYLSKICQIRNFHFSTLEILK